MLYSFQPLARFEIPVVLFQCTLRVLSGKEDMAFKVSILSILQCQFNGLSRTFRPICLTYNNNNNNVNTSDIMTIQTPLYIERDQQLLTMFIARMSARNAMKCLYILIYGQIILLLT